MRRVDQSQAAGGPENWPQLSQRRQSLVMSRETKMKLKLETARARKQGEPYVATSVAYIGGSRGCARKVHFHFQIAVPNPGSVRSCPTYWGETPHFSAISRLLASGISAKAAQTSSR